MISDLKLTPMSYMIIFSSLIFCRQIEKFHVVCIIVSCLHLDLHYANCQTVSVSLEMWLPTRQL